MAAFPKGFLLGAATAAHQVEGGNIHSDYWVMENLPHSMFTEPSSDAVDHYNRYEEDIKLLADAGLNAYRFSIEWARIQPKPGEWANEEIEHYRKVLECCRANGVVPIVTMHHFSSPKWLISQGGWESSETVTLFAAYCERVVQALGGLMGYICTINEANMGLQLASLMRDMKRFRPSARSETGDVQVGVNISDSGRIALSMQEAGEAFGCDSRGINTFLSLRTPEGDKLIMRAHEAARDAMKAVCPHLKVGVTLSLHDLQALAGGEEAAAKEWDEEFSHYLYAIKNDDFLGVQCYTRKRFNAVGAIGPEEGANRTQMGYEDYPLAVANVVRAVSRVFTGDIIITENGIATSDDERRVMFIKEALAGVQSCLDDGLNVKGYMYWSLLDNFEWQLGFSKTFGLITVDRVTQKR
ncbi:MAG: family 1 glycosylhydrolase, partial [Clostridiales bacterium]|nr:family 1 glycosylhydrolase [Clostridiales bacterium]